MAGPSILGGFSEGLWNSIDQYRAEAAARQREQDQTERAMLTSLLNSPDPKVQSLALGGILDMGMPKRRMKGVQGFLGEYERIPQIQQIHDYLTTPQTQTTTTPGLPSKSIAPALQESATPSNVAPSPDAARAPSTPSGAALPASSPVTGGPMVGTPPPTMGSAFQIPHTGMQGGQTTTTTTTYPHAFYTPEEQIIASERSKTLGDIAGWEAAGMPHEQAVRQVQIERMHRNAMMFGGVTQGSMLPEGTMDAFGRPVQPNQQYRAQMGIGPGGQSGMQYFPVVTPASMNPLKVIQDTATGNPILVRVHQDNTFEKVADVPVGAKYMNATNADGSQDIVEVPSFVPSAASLGLRPSAATVPTTAPTATPPPASGAPPAAPAAPAPPAASATPSQPSTAPTPAIAPAVTGGPTGAGTGTPPPSPQSAAVVAPPQPGQGPVTVRKGKPTQTRATFYRPGSTALEQGYKTKDGHIFDLNGTEVAGAAEVPESANVPKPLSGEAKTQVQNAQNALGMIDRIMASMDKNKAGLVPEGALQQLKDVIKGEVQNLEYNITGSPSDPLYKDLIPYASLLQTMTSSSYLHGIRNQQFISQIQHHTPTSTDSMQAIRYKLGQMKSVLQGVVQNVYEAEGARVPTMGGPVSQAAPGNVGAPPPKGTASPAQIAGWAAYRGIKPEQAAEELRSGGYQPASQ